MTGTTRPIRILVVDDEPDLLDLYELTLLREGYLVHTAESVQQARAQLADLTFDVVITDMRLPDGMGISLLHEIKQAQRGERCVVITAYGSAENAVEALKAGAFDYLTKPVDLRQFRSVVASAVTGGPAPFALSGQKTGKPTTVSRARQSMERLVGRSVCMRSLKERILKVATSMAPVMVTGESGTGKELAAFAIHCNSHRAQGPWVAVNCSAIPEALLEAEFFGAKKGAYTGADQDREGFFQSAHGGTLFLDEIGDLPLPMQSKLLRAIQERRVRPLGSTLEEPVDVRIISATHKNLEQEVAQGRFRQDLYYRLNVIDLTIAPLRERSEDIADICAALLARIAEESATPVPALAPEVVARLAQLPLPGNVRELENLLYRLVALGDAHGLSIDAPPQQAAQPSATPTPARIELPTDLQAYLDGIERDILSRALQETDFNRTAAAARLGLSLRQIRYRIARLQIAIPNAADDNDATD